MNEWFQRVRFVWEEPVAPSRPGPGVEGPEPAGVPPPLRKATRFALIGVAATSLLGQVVGVRLTAPVDAAPSYVAMCIQNNCKGLTGQARAECNNDCQEANEQGDDTDENTNNQSSLPAAGTNAAASQSAAEGASQGRSARSTPKPRAPWWYEWVPFLSDQRSNQ